jgi:hypothetical protein
MTRFRIAGSRLKWRPARILPLPSRRAGEKKKQFGGNGE